MRTVRGNGCHFTPFRNTLTTLTAASWDGTLRRRMRAKLGTPGRGLGLMPMSQRQSKRSGRRVTNDGTTVGGGFRGDRFNMNLSEKYRPASLSEVIGQEKSVAVIERMRSNLGGRAFWITGKSGVGKTTLARIIASHVADQWNTREIVGRQLTVGSLRELQDHWAYVAMGEKPGYALIVNEAHGLSKPIVEILLDVLEGLRSNTVVIFTTTHEGNDLFEETKMDAGPFASRCVCLSLGSQGVTPKFAKRLKTIAELEGLDGRPESEYIKLVNRCSQNFRECLGRIEMGEMLSE